MPGRDGRSNVIINLDVYRGKFKAVEDKPRSTPRDVCNDAANKHSANGVAANVVERRHWERPEAVRVRDNIHGDYGVVCGVDRQPHCSG